MYESLPLDERIVRLAVFFTVLIAMAGWELAQPTRRHEIPRLLRWTSNLGIVVIDTLLVRLAFPLVGVGLALVAEQRGWGLFNVVETRSLVAFLVSFLAFDLAIYFQHVLFHAVPALWRLHRMHHADLEFDVTTGLRFHPIEILISMGIKLALVAALGPPALVVLTFEVLLNATAMFNHGNVRIPARVDRVLRWFVVTPDMHRVHHSVLPNETNSNFGFNLPWWDRLLGTYCAQPSGGHEDMTIGIEQFRTHDDLRLDRMLLQPLRSAASIYPINERPQYKGPGLEIGSTSKVKRNQ